MELSQGVSPLNKDEERMGAANFAIIQGMKIKAVFWRNGMPGRTLDYLKPGHFRLIRRGDEPSR